MVLAATSTILDFLPTPPEVFAANPSTPGLVAHHRCPPARIGRRCRPESLPSDESPVLEVRPPAVRRKSHVQQGKKTQSRRRSLGPAAANFFSPSLLPVPLISGRAIPVPQTNLHNVGPESLYLSFVGTRPRREFQLQALVLGPQQPGTTSTNGSNNTTGSCARSGGGELCDQSEHYAPPARATHTTWFWLSRSLRSRS